MITGHTEKVANAHYRRSSEDLMTSAAAFATGTLTTGRRLGHGVGHNPGQTASENSKNKDLEIAEAVRLVEAKTAKNTVNSAENKKPPLAQGFPKVARAGLEPATPAFSMLCSTN